MLGKDAWGGPGVAIVIALIIGGSLVGDGPKGNPVREGCVGACTSVELRGAGNKDGVYEVPEGQILGDFLKKAGLKCEHGCQQPLEAWMRIEWGSSRHEGSGPTLRRMRESTRFLMGELMDVNRADIKDLSLLEGIGPVLAARIVRDRRARGPFHCPEDLLRVNGMGPAKLEKIRPVLSFES